MRSVTRKNVLRLAIWCAAAIGAVTPASAQGLEEAVPFRFDSDSLSQSELRAVLDVLCPGNAVIGPQESGCGVCPADTTSPGARIGSRVEYTLRGHFLSRRSDDLIVVLNGCTSHAGGDRDPILLTRRAGVWRAVGRGGGQGRCRKITNREGVDGLLCLTEYTQHGGTTFWLSFGYVGTGKVTVLTIDEAREIRQLADGRGQRLLEVSDHRNEACFNAFRGVMPIVVPGSEILAIEVNQSKGNTTLLVRVSCSRGKLTTEWRKGCAGNESPPGEIRLDAIERTFELSYTFDGDMFVLNKASQAAKRQLETCAALPRR